MKLFKITKTTNSRGAVGTSTSAVACALACKPQPPASFMDTSFCAVASTFKNHKINSSLFQK